MDGLSLWSWHLLCLALILLVTVGAGAYPFLTRAKQALRDDFQSSEALAAGVFLGAGLIHMLADSAADFVGHGIGYPIPFLLCGATFLLLLFLEHVGRELYSHHSGDRNPLFAVLAVLMLSLHSFLAGAALGLNQNLGLVLIILFAILAHKWAASFSLALHLVKSRLSVKVSLLLFMIFALMVPLGILFGHFAAEALGRMPLLTPVFTALAAGTFLYLGTLHGLTRAVMVKQCCDLRHFFYVVAGFGLMALVAIWV